MENMSRDHIVNRLQTIENHYLKGRRNKDEALHDFLSLVEELREDKKKPEEKATEIWMCCPDCSSRRTDWKPDIKTVRICFDCHYSWTPDKNPHPNLRGLKLAKQEKKKKQKKQKIQQQGLGNKGEWEKRVYATDPEINKRLAATGDMPDETWVNRVYQVIIFRNYVQEKGWPTMHWLSIKRRDRVTIHDWRDLQQIKNDLIGEKNEAVELYPSESRLVDSSNQYHLWVLADPEVQFPFGFQSRVIAEGHEAGTGWKNSKQRPWPEGREPEDAISAEHLADSAAKQLGMHPDEVKE